MEARIAEQQADSISNFNEFLFKHEDKDENKEDLRNKVIEILYLRNSVSFLFLNHILSLIFLLNL